MKSLIDCVLFGLKSVCAEACRAPVKQSIVLQIALLCFQVEFDRFTVPAAVAQICRSSGHMLRSAMSYPQNLGYIRMAC